ncbi:MAG: Smr/MutS family protein [Gemmatimonadales bacterium]
MAVLRELTDLCRPEADAIAALHEMGVAADDLMARVRYAHATRAAVPAVGGEDLVLRQGRHPLLLARGIEVVPVDLELRAEERTLLVSGPNAGGKTVLLKTVGLSALLAQSGVVPPVGPGTALPVFQRMFADIGDHQSIAADLSTFSAHLAALRIILEQADAETLVLMDEIGSGTDPMEGAALAGATLRCLTAKGARSLVTTHLGALKTLAGEVAGVVNGSLAFDAELLRPTFRFTKGVPGRSYGIAIARRLGVDAAVVDEAARSVPERERALDELLAKVEARARDLEAREAVLEDRLAQVGGREEALGGRESLVAEREERIRRREKDAEREGRREARRHLLDAREKVEEAIRMVQEAGAAEAVRAARRVVEEAAQAEAQALDELETEAAPALAETIAVGQRVRVGHGAVGSVLELRADGRALVAIGAVKMVVGPAELTVVAAERRERAHAPDPVLPTVEAPSEIDLRGLTGEEAHEAVIAALDAAVLADRPFLRIIHGMGTGVVRDRVRRVLQSDRRVGKFDFAPRQGGGTGVTIAELAP